jgi:Holliday junction resolvase RusA-like endonuclease
MSMTSEAVTFVIDRKPPPSANRIRNLHWATRRELEWMWKEEVFYAVVNAGKPRFARARVQLKMFYAVKRKRDTDNVLGGLGKAMIDGLRMANVIPDDDSETVEIAEPMLAIDRKNPRVEIEVSPL